MGMVKGQVVSQLTEKTGLDATQAEQSLPLAKDSILEGMTGALTSGNAGGVMDMIKGFAGGGGGASAGAGGIGGALSGLTGGGGGGGIGGMVKNAVYQNIASNFIGKLTSKLGIGPGIANQVSSIALPMIMSKFSNQVTDDNGNVDQSDLMSKLGVGNMLGDAMKGKAGDMLKGGLGGMFGK